MKNILATVQFEDRRVILRICHARVLLSDLHIDKYLWIPFTKWALSAIKTYGNDNEPPKCTVARRIYYIFYWQDELARGIVMLTGYGFTKRFETTSIYFMVCWYSWMFVMDIHAR